MYVRSTFSKYGKINTASHLTGAEVARKILDKNGLIDVHIVETNGFLGDHYDPSRKVVRLSPDIFHKSTVASNAVAAHEVGHAIQDRDGYSMMRIRGAMVPFVNFTSQLGYVAILIGFLASLLDLLMIGILLISLTLIFQLVTLPVEFDASNKAKKELDMINILTENEANGVSDMLKAAAMTYVAAVLSTLLNILRLLLLSRGRD